MSLPPPKSMALSFDSHHETHPIPRGTSVCILRLGPFTPPFVEGEAVIKEVGDEPDRYWVRFTDDPVLRLRLVVSFGGSVCLTATALNRLWRSEAAIAAEGMIPANDN